MTAIQNAESNTYTYDYNGNGQLKSLADPLTHTMTWAFDSQGRRKSVANALGETVTYSYNDKSQVIAVTDPSDQTTNLIVDNDNRVITSTDPNTNSTWIKYDKNGRVRSTENALFKTWTTTYDKDGRAVKSENPLGEATTYAYDPAFNPIGSTSPGSIVVTMHYDDLNRVEAIETPHDGSTVRTTYTYNRSTSQDASGTTTYTWDVFGRLATTQLPAGGGTITYTYDTRDLLVGRDSGLGYTGYRWNGRVLAAETDASDNWTAQYNVQVTGYGGANVRTDLATGEQTQYLFDMSGNVRALADGNGKVYAERFYDAFGVLRNSSGPSTAGSYEFLGFGGQYGMFQDPDTGLVYCRARWYDPATKQFLTPDPLGMLGSGEQNLYGYAGNDPVNFTDPDGLDRVQAWGSQLFWQVQAPSGTFTKDRYQPGPATADHSIGLAAGGNQYVLHPRFGGSTITDYAADAAAWGVFSSRQDLSGLTRQEQEREIAKRLGGQRGAAGTQATQMREQWVPIAIEQAAIAKHLEGLALKSAQRQAVMQAEADAQAKRDYWWNVAAWVANPVGKAAYEGLGLAAEQLEGLSDALLERAGDSESDRERQLLEFLAMSTAISGGATEGLHGFSTLLSPTDLGRGIGQNYAAYSEMGVDPWTATVLQFNPLVGLAEAEAGVSYQAGDFGQELDSFERWGRGVTSVVATAGTVAGGAMTFNAGFAAGVSRFTTRGGGSASSFLRNQAAGMSRRRGLGSRPRASTSTDRASGISKSKTPESRYEAIPDGALDNALTFVDKYVTTKLKALGRTGEIVVYKPYWEKLTPGQRATVLREEIYHSRNINKYKGTNMARMDNFLYKTHAGRALEETLARYHGSGRIRHSIYYGFRMHKHSELGPISTVKAAATLAPFVGPTIVTGYYLGDKYIWRHL